MSLTIASDEDMTIAFVLVEDGAQTADEVLQAFLDTVPEEWGYRFDEESVRAAMPVRRWYRYDEEGDQLVACDADDARRDSEWWGFPLPEDPEPCMGRGEIR